MEKFKLEKMDLSLYYEKVDNGLEVYIVPKDNVNSIYATFSTRYGSVNNDFVPEGCKKIASFPLGIAHFLEHKLFEQKDGKDPFEFYSERGSDANANTSNFKTTYLFSGTNFFEENLNYLLDYVQDPYFTDENVEKEKGIIEQEIRMYDDSPFWKLYERATYNAFHLHPIKYPIAGTISTIKKITKENLYTCYKTFYHPSNMFLVITGNVDPKETINLIKLNQEKKSYKENQPIKIKKYDEPDTVLKTTDHSVMSIQIPRASIGYKIANNTHLDINKFKDYLSLFFDIKLGSVSEFNDSLIEKGLISNDIDINVINTDKHLLFILLIESDNVDKVIKSIDKELKNREVLESDFIRKKKVKKSSSIYKSDNIYSINNKIMGNIINYGKVILDEHKMIDELTYNEFISVIKNIDMSNKTIYKINKPTK